MQATAWSGDLQEKAGLQWPRSSQLAFSCEDSLKDWLVPVSACLSPEAPPLSGPAWLPARAWMDWQGPPPVWGSGLLGYAIYGQTSPVLWNLLLPLWLEAAAIRET